MIVALSPREIKQVLAWKGGAFWPDEERVMRRLRQALEKPEEPLRLSRLQLNIVCGWGEEVLGGHYGGGEVRNPDEDAVMAKLRTALLGPQPPSG